ncbi:hypothetical protein GOODEAATRI_006715 [Goodea atripinnis]|uniref:Uncharacterized protein n=1 Tax=Goodea atripinnis TaxID=208336 RepID=A0ABV0MFX7_9TELE
MALWRQVESTNCEVLIGLRGGVDLELRLRDMRQTQDQTNVAFILSHLPFNPVTYFCISTCQHIECEDFLEFKDHKFCFQLCINTYMYRTRSSLSTCPSCCFEPWPSLPQELKEM